MRKELEDVCSKAPISLTITEVLYLQVELANAHDQLAASKAREARLVDALQKIDEPMKYHHWEEDPYTRAGCFQFVAHEALKADPEGVATLAAIREAMVAIQHASELGYEGSTSMLLKDALAKLKEVFGEPR